MVIAQIECWRYDDGNGNGSNERHSVEPVSDSSGRDHGPVQKGMNKSPAQKGRKQSPDRSTQRTREYPASKSPMKEDSLPDLNRGRSEIKKDDEPPKLV